MIMYHVKFNRSIANITLLLCAAGLCLLVLLALLGTEEEPPIPVPPISSTPLADKGSIANSYSDTITGTFSDRGNLYVVFTQGKEIYLNFYNNDGVWLEHPLALHLQSDYGVEAATIQDPNEPTRTIVCLFLKKGDKNSGIVQYTCSPIEYNPVSQIPAFAFPEPKEFKMPVEDYEYYRRDLAAVAQSPNYRDEFDLVLNEYYFNNPNGDFYQIRRYKCKINKQIDLNDVNLNTICRLEVSSVSKSKQSIGPSIVSIPSIPVGDNGKLTKNLFHTFYASIENNYAILYASLEGPRLTPYFEYVLLNKDIAVRYTQNRNSAHFLDADQTIYVAYKNKDDTGVRFSKISLSNWLDNYGEKKWVHCDLKENGSYIANSNEGPSLFEHQGQLYLLYSDAHLGNILTYLRIDSRC